MNSEQKPDFLEEQGYTYNDSTFDDIFVKKFRDFVEDVSTESSEDENEGGANKAEEED